MFPHKIIRARRKDLGISESDIARFAGMSIFEYGDLESHSDEMANAVSLGKVRKVCEFLRLNVCNLLKLPKAPWRNSRSRAALIRRVRKKRNLSKFELADQIGFHREMVEKIEREANGIDEYPIDVVKNLAKILHIPSTWLIENLKQRRRGHL